MKSIYSKEEFIEKAKIEESFLDKLIEAEVIRPAGRVDGSDPYFDTACLKQADASLKLVEIGYSVDDVIRIQRKVGLPAKNEAEERVKGPLLTVGELAKRIDSNARTIKHWEEKGIIEPDSHSPGGFRLYRERYVDICVLVQDLQNFGYTLDQIKVIADLIRDFFLFKKDLSAFPMEKVDHKITAIRGEMKQLNQKMQQMEAGIARWRKRLKNNQKELANIEGKVKKWQENEKSKQFKATGDMATA